MNKEFEQTFAQRRYTNDNKHMKIFGTSLILKEIKFKTKGNATQHLLGAV